MATPEPPPGWQPPPGWVPPGYQQQPPPRKRRRKWPYVLGGLLALIVVIGIASSSGGGKSSSSSSPAVQSSTGSSGSQPLQHASDVVVTSCVPDSVGFAAAKVVVTNTSSKASNYVITVTFESAGGATQVGTGLATVDGLLPGQKSVPQDVSSLQAAPAGYTCRVTDVTRYAT